jgi:hypothetical protein
MNAGAPARGWALAGQELRPKTEHNQMKAEAALLYFSLHDPIEDKVKGFPGQRVGDNFNTGIQAASRIVETGTGRQVA